MTAQPALRITHNGQRLPEDARVRLTKLRVTQVASSPSQAELWWALEDAVPAIEVEDALDVHLGGQPLFEGRVRATELSRGDAGQLVLRVRAYDTLDELRRQSKLETRSNEGLDAFVRACVQNAELGVEGFDSGSSNAYMFGRGRTDLAQLRAVTSRFGHYFHLDQKTLRGFTLEPKPRAPDASTESAPIASEARARTPEIHWRQLVEAKLSNTAVGTAARVRVLGSHLSASEHFDAEFGSGDDHLIVPGQVLASKQQAQTRANALSTLAQAAAKHLRAVLLPGNGTLKPGQTLGVAGVPGARSTLHFVLTQVIHTVDPGRGYSTEVSTEPPAMAEERTEAATVTIGQVVELNDDGRVRVLFPDYQERSDWLRVVSPGAGSERGFVMLPDKGDHVVVLSPDTDPSHGVVLGGVWTEGPRDAGVSNAERRRSEWGNARQRVSFDEDAKSLTACSGHGATMSLEDRNISLHTDHGQVTVTDGRGSGLELKGGHVRLYSSRPLTIESPGQPLRIRASRIDFEEA